MVLGPRDAGDRIGRLETALGWWHGDALEEFAAEPWAIAAAVRLESLRAAAIEELAERWIEARRPADAIALLESHAARHPLADAPAALLLRALASAGRRTEALRVAHRYRTELRRTAGLEPGGELREIERRVADGWDGRAVGPSPPPRLPPRSPALPTPATRRVGPSRLLDGIVADLTSHRVVTLTGPGGVGKTRASLEAAHRSVERYPDGVVVVELAPLLDAGAVPDAVAAALGIATRAGLSVTGSIAEGLAGRSLLLVLDNCEHVVAAVAAVVRAIVAGCPTVTVLATSREPLGVRGERVVIVRPLALADGVELFSERALAADEGATFVGQERSAVEAICRRLDSLPLAVELAAARARSIAPADLLARLGERFEGLGAVRDGQHHQRTLWTTIDWSYQLLDHDERLLFDQLAVFHGSFDLAAVERVGMVPGRRPVELGGVLAGLVDKSMVVTEREPDVVRYRLLDTLRQFAVVRLAERGATAETAERHLRHYVELAAATDRRWFGPDQAAADAAFDREWGNLRGAHAWASAAGHADLDERLLLATLAHSQLRMRSEHGAWCATAIADLDVAGEVPSAALLGWGAWWAMIGGALPRAIDWCSRGLARPAPPDDPGACVCRAVLAFALWSSGRSADAAGRVAELEAVLPDLPPWEEYTGQRALFSFSAGVGFAVRAERIAALAEAMGAPSLVASARFYQGTAALTGSDAADREERAVQFHLEGIELARATGAELAECQNLQGLLDAKVALDAPDIVATCLEALRRLYELRYWLYLWRVLDAAAWLVARAGRMEEAGHLLGHLDRVASPWRTRPRATTRALVAEAGIGADVLARGAALDQDAAVRMALATLESLSLTR